jgi:hypothetical protein
MRRLLAFSALMLALLPARAADEPKPNTLTPKEIADGWLLLFDGETTFGWKIEGEAKVANGVLHLGGQKETTAATTTQFDACTVRFQYSGENVEKVVVRTCGYECGLKKDANNANTWIQALFSVYSTEKGRLGSAHFESTGTGLLGATKLINPVPRRTGPVVLTIPAGQTLQVRHILLRPRDFLSTTGETRGMDLKPIFNGKDLTGWKEHPGKKSKCAVNDKGEITMKDGPGDLQSEGQWDNFVLQIECKTNGKHLNSGVFFRCRPNEYQQGYEAQIHNGFAAEPTKEYTIETYDPDNGKVLTTRKEKYAALDYGTGGIYRRMPARKQAAQDGEWFTMTVVAEGRHLATWVNGLQMVDWTDTRPVKDNARNGCKLEKGPISLQGHDPTTDLNFRNIRIGELR